MTLVRNVESADRCEKPEKPLTGESSWLKYWEKQTGKIATQCSARDCQSSQNLVGAHVKSFFFGHDYIVPICEKCSQRTNYFEVDAEPVDVPSEL